MPLRFLTQFLGGCGIEMSDGANLMTYSSLALSVIALLISGASLYYSRVVHLDNGGRAELVLLDGYKPPLKRIRVVFLVRNTGRGPLNVTNIIFGQGLGPDIELMSQYVRLPRGPKSEPLFMKFVQGPTLPLRLDGNRDSELWTIDTSFYPIVLGDMDREMRASVMSDKRIRVGVVLGDHTSTIRGFSL